ncbi:MAG: hypothetical protein CYPHOPRED_002175 [Cyphobasidiales sp. Tagirdzhanova-0007]|nr:MAG: hypothetical protein CYPHOPRED_002175 [Cyphobasidiales sp. Tagirdzhanova-0007]
MRLKGKEKERENNEDEVDDDDNDDDDDDEAPLAISSAAARTADRALRVQQESSRAAQRRKNREAASKQVKKPTGTTSTTGSSVIDTDKTNGKPVSSRLPPELFAQANEAFLAAKEKARLEHAATIIAAEKQKQKQKLANKPRTGPIKGKKRKFHMNEFHEGNEADNLVKRVVGNLTVQQLPTTPDTTLSLDSSTALPSQASSAFLQDRLFKRRKIRLGKGKNALNSKKGLKDTETPFLLFDPLLDKSPEKRERTRGEEKAVLEHKMRGRQSGGIIFPVPGFLLVANSTATNATVPFQYSNGERADNTTCSVSLANDTAVYLIASNVTFYNSYFVNVTLEISFANFTDGNYTLIAQELFEGDVESELTQPFAISHNAYAPHPTSLDSIRKMSDLKRPASTGGIDDRPHSKKHKPLDGWLAVGPVKRPRPFGISSPLQDKDSTFLAYAAQAESAHDIKRVREYVVEQANEDFHPNEPASHVAHGARFLSLKPGRSGLDESHFEVSLNMENDGEDKAGRTIVDALAGANACDVIVCVSRWFGGSFLGPRRFDDIRKVALEALYALRDEEKLLELQNILEAKDKEIYDMLKSVSRKAGTAVPSARRSEQYDNLDLAKARRLLAARDLRIGNLKLRLDTLDKEAKEDLPDFPG